MKCHKACLLKKKKKSKKLQILNFKELSKEGQCLGQVAMVMVAMVGYYIRWASIQEYTCIKREHSRV